MANIANRANVSTSAGTSTGTSAGTSNAAYRLAIKRVVEIADRQKAEIERLQERVRITVDSSIDPIESASTCNCVEYAQQIIKLENIHDNMVSEVEDYRKTIPQLVNTIDVLKSEVDFLVDELLSVNSLYVKLVESQTYL
tara:strand:+ start:4104 stop:4523 length:420 start_codon:yes stop_codon:yes gene_type:complete